MEAILRHPGGGQTLGESPQTRWEPDHNPGALLSFPLLIVLLLRLL